MISTPLAVPAPRRSPLGRVPPVTLLLGSIVSVQIGAAVAKGLFGALGPAGTSLLRVGFAAILLLAVWRPSLRRRTRAQALVVMGFGLTLALMNTLFYGSLQRVPLGIAVAIEFVGPLGVAVAGSRRALDVAWVALAAAGIALLAPWGGNRIDPLGVALALAAGGCWAAYILLSARAGRLFSDGSGLALAMAVATLAMLAPGIAQAGVALTRPLNLLAGAGVAVLSSAVPYSLEIEALRRMPARVFGTLMSLEPAVAALAGLILLGERLAGRDLAAIALVMLASAGVTLWPGRMA